MTATAVVRPLPGAGLVTRSGDLLLVCADGAAGVEELLGLVAEVASSGGDGSVLVRRVAALLAADFAGRYPACAACGPTSDGRLAVLMNGIFENYVELRAEVSEHGHELESATDTEAPVRRASSYLYSPASLSKAWSIASFVSRVAGRLMGTVIVVCSSS